MADTKKTNYTISELVEIGDQIHHSDSTIIIATTSLSDNDQRTFISVRGNHKELVLTLAEAFHSSEDLYDLVTEALCLKTLRDLKGEDIIKKQ